MRRSTLTPLPRRARRPRDLRVTRDVARSEYRRLARLEFDYWARTPFSAVHLALDSSDASRQAGNLAYTGHADRSWLDDVIARGPFRRAAALGCNEAAYEGAWLRAGASKRLDVFELSRGVIRKVRSRLAGYRFGIAWPDRRVRFHAADLNFARLPRDRYDVIWTSGCLHHIPNLEHLCAEVEAALHTGGLFAILDYVGERRLQYDPDRLALVNEVFRAFPPQFRVAGAPAVTAPRLEELSPFCGVRSDEILSVAQARFDVVHLGQAGALFPIRFFLDFHALERDAPDLINYLNQAELDAARTVRCCGAYAVLRKRGDRGAVHTPAPT